MEPDPVIHSSEIAALLQRWQRGDLSARDVHAWAEERYAVYDTDPESTKEVLGHHDMLNMNLVTVEDVPLLLAALHAADPRALIKECYRQRPIAERQQRLRDDSCYRPFCETP